MTVESQTIGTPEVAIGIALLHDMLPKESCLSTEILRQIIVLGIG